MYKIIKYEDWEEFVSPTGEVLAEGHILDVEDVLFALGIPVEFEYVLEEDDQSSSFSL